MSKKTLTEHVEAAEKLARENNGMLASKEKLKECGCDSLKAVFIKKKNIDCNGCQFNKD